MKRLAFFLFLFAALPLFAQGTSAPLTGRVTSAGKPVAGATITVEADTLQRARTATTNADGWYWVGALPPGTYRVTFEREGLTTLVKSVELHLDEPGRGDADLAPSTEGDVVTQTALTRTPLQSPQLVTSLSSAVVDPLPVDRSVGSYVALEGFDAPASFLIRDGLASYAFIDLPGDAIAETALVHIPVNAEYGRQFGGEIDAVTRSGGNAFSGSLRETWRSRALHFANDEAVRSEVTAGGRLIRDALWFFLAGDSVQRNALAKLTGSPDARQSVVAELLHGRRPYGTVLKENEFVADYTAVVVPSFVAEARAANSWGDYTTLRGYAFAHGHDLAFGAERLLHQDAFFVNDRWLVSPRLFLNLGIRHDEPFGTSPRFGAVFDPAGDGRNRFSASYGRFGDLRFNFRTHQRRDETSVAYARQLEANGYVRVAYLHHDVIPDVVELEGAYRFLIATFGGIAALSRERFYTNGSAWVQVEPPLLDKKMNISLLERYFATEAFTDLAFNYALPHDRWEPFAKFEVIDVFKRQQRGYRVGLGVRM